MKILSYLLLLLIAVALTVLTFERDEIFLTFARGVIGFVAVCVWGIIVVWTFAKVEGL